MLSGDAEKLAARNKVLEHAKRIPDQMNPSFLKGALEGKSVLENDPDAAKRFFSEWIAGAGSDDELFRALRMKLSYIYDRELVKEAHEEIVAKFADTRDAGQARIVVDVLESMSWADPLPSDEKNRLYSSLIDRFAGATDEAGLGVYMSALLGKAGETADAAEKADLCDRILAAPVPAGVRSLESLRENAVRLKSKTLFAPEILAQYYAGRVAREPSATLRARLLLSQAKAEPSRAKKEVLYDQIIDRYRTNTDLVTTMEEAFNDRAELAANREEARRRDRETLEFVTGLKRTQRTPGRILNEVYDKLIALAPGTPERIALYDEQIRMLLRYDEKGMAARVMLEKAELVAAPEKIAIYDQVIVSQSDGGGTNEHSLMDALLAKAEAVADDTEKNALYDRVIAVAGSMPMSYFRQRQLVNAVAGKAKLPGGEHSLEEYLDTVLQRGSDLAGNAGLAAALTDPAERAAYYDSMIAQWDDAGRGTGHFLAMLYLNRTALINDRAERKAALERALGELGERDLAKNELEPLYRALIDLNVEERTSGDGAKEGR